MRRTRTGRGRYKDRKIEERDKDRRSKQRQKLKGTDKRYKEYKITAEDRYGNYIR